MPTPVVDPATPDYTTLSILQLKDEAQRLARVVDLANSQRMEIFALVERRKLDAQAQQRVAAMSEVQKDALREALA